MNIQQVQIFNFRIRERRKKAAENSVKRLLGTVHHREHFRPRFGKLQIQNAVSLTVKVAGKSKRSPGLPLHIQIFHQNIAFGWGFLDPVQILYSINFPNIPCFLRFVRPDGDRQKQQRQHECNYLSHGLSSLFVGTPTFSISYQISMPYATKKTGPAGPVPNLRVD